MLQVTHVMLLGEGGRGSREAGGGAAGAAPLPLPDAGALDWAALVHTATRAMLQVTHVMLLGEGGRGSREAGGGAAGAAPLPLPDAGALDWAALVHTATRAMLQICEEHQYPSMDNTDPSLENNCQRN
ncbi:uncharacterized protein LOC113497410 [Trichoplusia ni]|uniref:Uncharacterized protein LOC113497410 n=1 Tax=Trichoplusia ni TaxID=7111 RepID=A0A7E5VXB0_TRINI|nr:uncharacterized protein LOC113497410 [Trichoplusia ni]